MHFVRNPFYRAVIVDELFFNYWLIYRIHNRVILSTLKYCSDFIHFSILLKQNFITIKYLSLRNNLTLDRFIQKSHLHLFLQYQCYVYHFSTMVYPYLLLKHVRSIQFSMVYPTSNTSLQHSPLVFFL